MEPKLLLGTARDQLNLILSFFPRVDAKASVLLAVDTGMAGYLASRLRAPQFSLTWQLLAPLVTFLLVALSFWHLYKSAFPNLAGGNLSLVYFREIAKRTETRFIDEFIAQQEADYVKDVLGQVWRNSEILTQKFIHLKWAFFLTAAAVIPWTISIAQRT
jgi:hypothetical protein